MDGNIQHLLNFMRGQSRIIIPVYQRNYDWKIDNCERLFLDLLKIHKEGRATHFFGNIVVKPGDKNNETIVIDGQQRITSVSLLLLAISNYLHDNNITDGRYREDNIKSAFLVDDFAMETYKQKLVPNPNDKEAYRSLYGDSKFLYEPSNITLNYKYYLEEIKKLNLYDISLEALMQSILKLQVMVVNLNSPDDDAQLIFESLNSTGLELSEADKIRNFLLMNEDTEKQNYYFSNYWEPIEKRTKYDLSEFFRYYLTIKQNSFPVKSRLYESFKTYFNAKAISKDVLFDELNDYAYIYEQIINNSIRQKKVNRIIFRLNFLGVSVVKPFLMQLLYEFNNNQLSEDNLLEMLSLVESYIVRRLITETPSSGLNKIFASLYKDYSSILNNPCKYGNHTSRDILAYLLLKKENTGIFPKDIDFINSFRTRNFYNMNKDYRTYIFERLENHNHIEALNIYEGISEGQYSIEHIMPQKLSDSWIKELGEDYKQIHETYLNQMGNLTLTGYNSKYSNYSFDEKKSMEKGYDESHFVNLNRIPKEVSQWGKDEIKRRTEELLEIALKVWPYPTTSLAVTKEEPELFIYDGDMSFSNYSLSGYIFQDKGYQPTRVWIDLYIDILGELAKIDYNLLLSVAQIKKEKGWENYISIEAEKGFEKVTEGIYAKKGINNGDKFNVIQKLFDLYHIDYDALQIDASDKNTISR
ncbi:DUF262 domain-containing protein [Ignavigranum ruoffiae]|uniref:DUF262 domain-containing protein n=2 Tax=Ignavigranum ruoffiae TaxID=89093 RepID=UPI00205F109D|nr:DUF262 domain-containing protein [Ignavigranum ruoffiae]UPQ86601.1 DUF262 domain-containing protein [Ignavigranum ruoffiae]